MVKAFESGIKVGPLAAVEWLNSPVKLKQLIFGQFQPFLQLGDGRQGRVNDLRVQAGQLGQVIRRRLAFPPANVVAFLEVNAQAGDFLPGQLNVASPLANQPAHGIDETLAGVLPPRQNGDDPLAPLTPEQDVEHQRRDQGIPGQGERRLLLDVAQGFVTAQQVAATVVVAAAPLVVTLAGDGGESRLASSQ